MTFSKPSPASEKVARGREKILQNILGLFILTPTLIYYTYVLR